MPFYIHRNYDSTASLDALLLDVGIADNTLADKDQTIEDISDIVDTGI